MSMMREIPYLLATHYVVLAMRPVTFPVSERELIAQLGDVPIQTGPGSAVPFRALLEPIPLEAFSCAAEFYCALNAS